MRNSPLKRIFSKYKYKHNIVSGWILISVHFCSGAWIRILKKCSRLRFIFREFAFISSIPCQISTNPKEKKKNAIQFRPIKLNAAWNKSITVSLSSIRKINGKAFKRSNLFSVDLFRENWSRHTNVPHLFSVSEKYIWDREGANDSRKCNKYSK